MKTRTILNNVKRAIREPHAWPGGYPVYTVLTDGTLLCPVCARENYKLVALSTIDGSRDGWAALGTDILWEGEGEQCAHCYKELQSAYGADGVTA